MIPVVSRIRSGGQTGVDRGAHDAARALGVMIAGWVPQGGWAEDSKGPPGLLEGYPELVETPSGDVSQRTEWNVRDSHATLILVAWPEVISPGTSFTAESARKYARPYRELTEFSPEAIAEAFTWLYGLGRGLTVNIGGPRESEAPGAYGASQRFVDGLLKLQLQGAGQLLSSL